MFRDRTRPLSRRYSDAQERTVERINRTRSEDCYGLLNVKKTDNIRSIKKSYKKLALICHPDKNPHPGAALATQKLNQAYEILKDPRQRWLLDHQSLVFCMRQPTTPGYPSNLSPQQARMDHIKYCREILWRIFVALLCVAFCTFLYYGFSPPYSLEFSPRYPRMRHTKLLKTRYYVKNDFIATRRRVLWTNIQIERLHFPIIRQECLDEVAAKSKHWDLAMKEGDMHAMYEAENMKTEACLKLLQAVATIRREYTRLRKQELAATRPVSKNDWRLPITCSKKYTHQYNTLRETWPLGIQYFVDAKFYDNYQKKLTLVDIRVEQRYLKDVVKDCQTELQVTSFADRIWLEYGIIERIVAVNPNMHACHELIELFPTLTLHYLNFLEVISVPR